MAKLLSARLSDGATKRFDPAVKLRRTETSDGETRRFGGVVCSNALFNRALRQEARLDTAFALARDYVTAREKREGFDPSNPQIEGGAEVLARLAMRSR